MKSVQAAKYCAWAWLCSTAAVRCTAADKSVILFQLRLQISSNNLKCTVSTTHARTYA